MFSLERMYIRHILDAQHSYEPQNTNAKNTESVTILGAVPYGLFENAGERGRSAVIRLHGLLESRNRHKATEAANQSTSFNSDTDRPASCAYDRGSPKGPCVASLGALRYR